MYVINRVQEYQDKNRSMYLNKIIPIVSYVPNVKDAMKFETKAEAQNMIKIITIKVNNIQDELYPDFYGVFCVKKV